MEEILKETQDIVNEICEKYGYDSEDKEGNDSLKTVLLKAIPSMLKDSKVEDRQLFYQMLRHTPIVITENLTKEGLDELIEQYIGDINPHIIEGKQDLGEYGKTVGDGAYVSEPIIDEDMQVIGKKSFLYIQRVEGKKKEFFGTDINVSHLEHELGHAWHAENDQYVMQEDGTLKNRIGTAEFIYSFSKGENGKFVQKLEKVTGLMIEEGMNTIAEEEAMANYMGMSLEEIREQYGIDKILDKSRYQGDIRDRAEYMLQELPREDFEAWRMYGDKESKAGIENFMSRTEYWKNRETDILLDSGSPRSYSRKREVIEKIENVDTKEFFKEHANVYFPDISQMTPLEKIDNVLEQSYTMHTIKHSMGLDNFKAFLDCMNWESHSLVNQTADLIAKEELVRKTVLEAIQNVTLSEVNEVTNETRKLTLEKEPMQKQGGISR